MALRTDNPVVDTIRSVFFREVVELTLKNLVKQFPFLGWWGINWMVASIVMLIATKFWNHLHVSGVYLEIDFRSMDHQREYQRSIRKVKAMLESNRPEDQKQKAIDEFKENLQKVIRMDNNLTLG
jgi:hypothetical protein